MPQCRELMQGGIFALAGICLLEVSKSNQDINFETLSFLEKW